MGNAQSNSSHPNRLSKPKTNTNSPIVPSKSVTGSPVSVTSKYAHPAVVTRKKQAKAQLSSPIRSDFSSCFSSKDDEEINELATQVQARLSSLSRSNSVASQGGHASIAKIALLRGSSASLISQNQGVDIGTALKILQEVRKSASPEDLAALHEALQSPSSSPTAGEMLRTRAAMFNRSDSSLTRRRSLLSTPGLATRHSMTEASRRSWNSWRTPTGPQDHKWKKDMMGTSPLTRLGAFDLAEDGQESSTPRARTPGDLEYTHLGSLQLGSLVVTNGAPSPAASARNISRRRSNSDLSQEDDYFSVAESSPTPAISKYKFRNHFRSKSSGLPQTRPLPREPHSRQARKAKATPRCGSPLKISELDDELPLEPKRLQVVNKSADTLAKAYMDDITQSPFSDPGEVQSSLDDCTSNSGAGSNAPAFRDEALQILDGTIFGEPDAATDQPQTVPPDTQAPTLPEIGSSKRKSRRPPPSTADSGYSSGGSLRVANRTYTTDETTIRHSGTSETAKLLRCEKSSDTDEAVSLYNFEQMLALPISRKPLPPTPTDQDEPAHSEHPVRLPESWERAVDCQLARLQASELFTKLSSTPAQTRPITSAVSQLTTESASSTQKRLQKRRPSMPTLPVVQSCQPVAEMTIPSVPVDVRSKFARRLSEAPEMECLMKTYLSKDHTDAGEPTVDPPTTMSLESPSSPSSLEPRGRHHRRRHTERPTATRVMRSLSLLRNKPEAIKKDKDKDHTGDDPPSNLIDLGTIGSTLGRSPYDAAMFARPKSTVVAHPHQLGDALPRARSMVNMDARAAAEFASMRSKERALTRPPMAPRPHSYHDVKHKAGAATTFDNEIPGSNTDLSLMPVAGKMTPPREMGVAAAVADNIPHASPQLSPSVRAPSTGRGPMVRQLVGKYDRYEQQRWRSGQQRDEPHARLRGQRRNSMGDGMRPRTATSQPGPDGTYQRASTEPPEGTTLHDRYGGGLDYGYQRGCGIGGSAGTRQLHSAANRKGMHLSNQFGLDLSDVPVLLQRIS